MSVQHVREVPAVITDEALRDRVHQAVDDLDTVVATNYAMSLGLTPPTGEPGWNLCQRFAADGSLGPLVWVHVTETTD